MSTTKNPTPTNKPAAQPPKLSPWCTIHHYRLRPNECAQCQALQRTGDLTITVSATDRPAPAASGSSPEVTCYLCLTKGKDGRCDYVCCRNYGDVVDSNILDAANNRSGISGEPDLALSESSTAPAPSGEAATTPLRLKTAEQLGVDPDELDGSEEMLWLTSKIAEGRGPVLFAYTEDGDIGVFVGGEKVLASGVGDTAEEALRSAVERWYRFAEKGRL